MITLYFTRSISFLLICWLLTARLLPLLPNPFHSNLIVSSFLLILTNTSKTSFSSSLRSTLLASNSYLSRFRTFLFCTPTLFSPCFLTLCSSVLLFLVLQLPTSSFLLCHRVTVAPSPTPLLFYFLARFYYHLCFHFTLLVVDSFILVFVS